MHGFALALRSVIGHVEIHGRAGAVRVIGQQVIVELQRVEVNTLHRYRAYGPSSAPAASEIPAKLARCGMTSAGRGSQLHDDHEDRPDRAHAAMKLAGTFAFPNRHAASVSARETRRRTAGARCPPHVQCELSRRSRPASAPH